MFEIGTTWELELNNIYSYNYEISLVLKKTRKY